MDLRPSILSKVLFLLMTDFSEPDDVIAIVSDLLFVDRRIV
jgi:hypothetical protein